MLLSCFVVIIACCLSSFPVYHILSTSQTECRRFNTTSEGGEISLNPYHEVFKHAENHNVEIIHTFWGNTNADFAIVNDTIYFMTGKRTIERVATNGWPMPALNIPGHIQPISFTITDHGDILLSTPEGVLV